MPDSRNLPAVLVALLLSGAVLGCGGSSSHTSSKTTSSGSSTTAAPTTSSGNAVSANAYVSSVCTAILPFEKDVQQRSSALDVTSTTSPAAGKRALQSLLTSAVSDAGKAVTQLQAAGSPNVANGQAVSRALVSAFTQLKTVLGKAHSDTNQLPTSNP